MISVNNVSLQFGQRKLFSEVNIVFSAGNCYGLIGANGSGKSTFLKILSGEVDSSSGEVVVAPGKRVSTLRQDQFAFDEYTVLTTVIMGHKKLYEIMLAKDALYSKTPFTDADGMRAGELTIAPNGINVFPCSVTTPAAHLSSKTPAPEIQLQDRHPSALLRQRPMNDDRRRRVLQGHQISDGG